jgi:hypothetical protein
MIRGKKMKSSQNLSIDNEVADYFLRVRYFENHNIEEIEEFLSRIEIFTDNQKIQQKIQLLRKTLNRMMSSKSIDEMNLYADSFNDIISTIELNTDILKMDTCIDGFLKYADSYKNYLRYPNDVGVVNKRVYKESQMNQLIKNFNQTADKLKTELIKQIEASKANLNFLKDNHNNPFVDNLQDEKSKQDRLVSKLEKIISLQAGMQNLILEAENSIFQTTNLTEYNIQHLKLLNNIYQLTAFAKDIQNNYQYRDKRVHNYLVNHCKEHIKALTEVKSSYLDSENEHIVNAMKEIAIIGGVTVSSYLPITGLPYMLVSYAIPTVDAAYKMFHHKLEEPIQKPSFFQRTKNSISTSINYCKKNWHILLGGVLALGTVVALPYLFLSFTAATALILTGCVIAGLAKGGYGLVMRGIQEHTRQQDLHKRLEEHQKDLEMYPNTPVLQPQAVPPTQVLTKFGKVMNNLFQFSKKHPWSTPLIAVAAGVGAILGWKVIAIAAVVSGTKMVVTGGTLATLKALASVGGAGGAASIATQGVVGKKVQNNIVETQSCELQQDSSGIHLVTHFNLYKKPDELKENQLSVKNSVVSQRLKK